MIPWNQQKILTFQNLLPVNYMQEKSDFVILVLRSCVLEEWAIEYKSSFTLEKFYFSLSQSASSVRNLLNMKLHIQMFRY